MEQQPGLTTKTPFEMARNGDVVAIRTVSGDTVGFHAYSLEVAELAPESWTALTHST